MMMMSTSTMPFNRKSLFVQTEEQELIHLRPEQDAEVQTEQVIENPLNRFGGQYREVKERGVDKSTQVKSISVSAEKTEFFRQITHIFLILVLSRSEDSEIFVFHKKSTNPFPFPPKKTPIFFRQITHLFLILVLS